jgi:hypothetical protein
MAIFMPDEETRLFAAKSEVFDLGPGKMCFIRKHASRTDLFYFESTSFR